MFKKSTLALAVGCALHLVSGCSDDKKPTQVSSAAVVSSSVASSSATSSSASSAPAVTKNFNRVATFMVCEQIEASCNTNDETVAEIVAASTDGNTLIYTDSPQNQIGFVDIATPAGPKKLGVLALGGEPTSVTVMDGYALVAVNTSADFVNTSGQLAVVDIASKTIIKTLELGGQPDSVAVSPNGQYIVIAIENERDEELGDGRPPQLPAGYLMVVDTAAHVNAWALRKIELTELPKMLYPADPEPEFISINSNNIAVVTLQENNHIALINLVDGKVTESVNAGSVDLTLIDATTTKPAVTQQTENKDGVLREPDGVTWMGTDYFVTANEGDMDGGSRGFTVFDKNANVVWDSGYLLEHLAASFGHYPEKRASKKGVEPENVAYGIFENTPYLFVNSERASVVFVFDVTDPTKPVFKQALPASAGPEGGLAIPQRNLLVVASEVDDREVNLRGALTIYQLADKPAQYPTIVSATQQNNTPISWGALSGLAAGTDANKLYAVNDSFYASNKIFELDISHSPAKIAQTIVLNDQNDVFSKLVLPTLDKADTARNTVFDKLDLMAMINADKTINIDAEGIAVADDGGFWIASEGNGTQGDDARPILSLNFIFKVSAQGTVEQVIALPDAINAKQVRFGYEGVAQADDKLYVAFQRAWLGDEHPRIGIYDLTNNTWRFVFYPLDAVASKAGGWVGLSDLTALGNGEFLVVERDNKAGFDAAIKRLYRIDLNAVTSDTIISKTWVRDLIPDLKAPAGMVAEKIEGLAVTADGDVYIVNDNDGLDDNSGETQLLNLGKILN